MFHLLPDNEKLLEIGKANADKYAHAEPYPHIALDNLFNPELLDKILEEFPDPHSDEWKKFKDPHQVKLATKGEGMFRDNTRFLLYYMNSMGFLRFLEALTGIKAIVPDPDYSGGGLHQIVRGGMLKIHADFNKHPRTRLDRRINAILYMNKDWKEEYGGHFELWDKDMKGCVEKVLPVYNRLAVFSTTSHSFHGHPDPLACPEGWSRKSLALYYYTNGRPDHEIEEGKERHSTLFKDREGQDNTKESLFAKKRIIRGIKMLTPPIVWQLAKKLKK